MLNLEWALFLIRSSVNAAYSLANFQGFNNVVSQWSPPLGKIFSGKHSPFPATFRPRRLQCSCWQLSAQTPTAVTCPVHQTILTLCPAACAEPCTALTRVCIICSVSLRCHWHCGGSAFNSHFQNQLCHLSWQMAFPVFGLSEAEKVSLPYLQYLILLMVHSYLYKLQCLELLIFFSCKAITKNKNYYWRLASKIYFLLKMHVVTLMDIKRSHKL